MSPPVNTSYQCGRPRTGGDAAVGKPRHRLPAWAHRPPVPTFLPWYYPNPLVTGHRAARILDELVKDMRSRLRLGLPDLLRRYPRRWGQTIKDRLPDWERIARLCGWTDRKSSKK